MTERTININHINVSLEAYKANILLELVDIHNAGNLESMDDPGQVPGLITILEDLVDQQKAGQDRTVEIGAVAMRLWWVSTIQKVPGASPAAATPLHKKNKSMVHRAR